MPTGFRHHVIEPFQGDLLRQSPQDDVSLREFARLWLTAPGIRFALTFRLGSWFWRYHHRSPGDLLLRLIHRRMVVRYGYEIPLSTSIGAGMRLGHLGPVIVNHRAVLGTNVSLHSGVVVGRRSDGPYEGEPIIGNNVLLAPGAKVLGKIVVGDNVVVAANSVVLKDVESGVTVAGLPATVVARAKPGTTTRRLVDERGRRIPDVT